ncbi:sensor histidine kinase [Vagococcus humatus]|uniref:histidine kinase n=1 Tax=Vagococcus humatus TaxID=1889241 RepID=A0A3R9YJL4_9ENTE|nr:sensor histidine kinase [Vagococcus humatus]RST89289.1 histidine kinase [Vagococcus humatus]
MSFFHFLIDQLATLIFTLILWLLSCLIIWLTPDVIFSWETVAYLAVLYSIVLTIHLLIRYSKKKNWWSFFKKTQEEQDYFTNYLELAQSHEDILIQEYLNQAINEHRDILTKTLNKQQEQQEFIDSWVHEIKLPLASLRLLGEALQDDLTDQHFYQMEHSLKQIESYVDQVLYYARLDSFSKDYLIQECQLKQLIIPILRENAHYFIQKNLHYEMIGEDQVVLTDQKWLSFILKQIISNSIKYTAEGGSLKIKLYQNSQGTWLSIEDNGIGIPLHEQRRIFDKGFTGSHGRSLNKQSTGLGLYLAKELCEKLGHQIFVESELNQGTTIQILFPYLTYFTQDNEEKLISSH